MMTDALEKVIAAINRADVSKQEKNESKSLLRKLLSSKAAAKINAGGVYCGCGKAATKPNDCPGKVVGSTDV
jgi:hypothetical protein